MRTVTNELRAGRRLLQACFTSAGVAAVLAASSVTGPLGPLGPQVAPADPPDVARHDVGTPVWRESWSERFPGCVALVLWPAAERPVALVTRSPGGQLRRVEAGSDRQVPAGDRAVGACR